MNADHSPFAVPFFLSSSSEVFLCPWALLTSLALSADRRLGAVVALPLRPLMLPRRVSLARLQVSDETLYKSEEIDKRLASVGECTSRYQVMSLLAKWSRRMPRRVNGATGRKSLCLIEVPQSQPKVLIPRAGNLAVPPKPSCLLPFVPLMLLSKSAASQGLPRNFASTATNSRGRRQALCGATKRGTVRKLFRRGVLSCSCHAPAAAKAVFPSPHSEACHARDARSDGPTVSEMANLRGLLMRFRARRRASSIEHSSSPCPALTATDGDSRRPLTR